MNHEPYCVLEFFYIMWHIKDIVVVVVVVVVIIIIIIIIIIINHLTIN